MNRKKLTGLLSCMLIGSITVAQDNMLVSAVAPVLAGAGGGALYTLAKSYYAHAKYDARGHGGEESTFAKTVTFGSGLVVPDDSGPAFSYEPNYSNPLALNMMLWELVGGSLGVLYGFYKNGAKEGCKVAAGSVIAFIAAIAASNELANRMSKRNRYRNGYYAATQLRRRPQLQPGD